MPVTEMLVPVAFFAALAFVIAELVRAYGARSLHRTITTAINSNSPVVEQLVAQLDRRPPVGEKLIGLVLVALAFAIAGAGALVGDSWEDWRMALAAALFPLLIGAALLAYRRLTGEPVAA